MKDNILTPKDILQKIREKNLPDNFCPIPFSNLLFEADGKVCLCRQKGNQFAVGDIKTQTVEEIWNGDMLKKIREEFLTGNIVTCAEEIKRDSCNLSVDNGEYLDLIDIQIDQQRLPLRISTNLNGKCNVKCEMCIVWKQPNGLYDEVGFWDKLEKEILPNLHEIDHFPGEPFIQKDTYRLIDLVHKVNPKIVWRFTTNGNWNLNKTIKNALDKINVKTIVFSIDSMNQDIYFQIREGAKLSQLLNSLDEMIEYEKERVATGKSDLGIAINYRMQKANWKCITDVLQLRREKNVRISCHLLVGPKHLSVLDYSDDKIEEIVDYLLTNITDDDFILITRLIRPLLSRLPSEKNAKYFKKYFLRFASLKQNEVL